LKCPYQSICPIVVFWYKDKQAFIKRVCNTTEHITCLHFQSLLLSGIKKGDKEWQRILSYMHQRKLIQLIRKNQLEMKEYGKNRDRV